jgi:hypothetical protein
MTRFSTVLRAGKKVPYNRWTFLVFPKAEAATWGLGRFAVRGEINGVPFTGTAAWGEGVLRIPLTAAICATIGVARGDRVSVTLAPDTYPPALTLPPALAEMLHADAALRAAFALLPPSAQRAWAAHIATAKRAETVVRRLAAAQVGIPARQYP